MKNEKPYPRVTFVHSDNGNDYHIAVLIIWKIIEASSPDEVDTIRDSNIDFLNANQRLFTFLINARKRIENLRKEKILNTEIIYLN